jgi:glycosyltransferase involved in cell wall biosynthesis
MISPEIPFPPVGGGRSRTYHLLRALAARHEVTLVGFTYEDAPEAAPYRVRVVAVPWEWPRLYRQMREGDEPASRSAYETLVNETAEPWFVSCVDSPVMEATLRRLAEDGFDLVWLEHTSMARFLPCFPTDLPKVLDLVDVHAQMARRGAEDGPGSEESEARQEADRTLRFERAVASQCTVCLACSGSEAAAMRTLLGIDHVRVVPNGVDTSFFTPSDGPPTDGFLLFTGTMSYEPNIEAVEHCARLILPAIREEIPYARLHIVGADPTEQVRRLACEGVIVRGRVPDMRPYYQRAQVVVVPLCRGGGTRLKILEAAACGKAIVTTSIGVEGLDFEPGEDLDVADGAAEFARTIVALARDEARRSELGRRARLVSLKYDWADIGTELCELVESSL